PSTLFLGLLLRPHALFFSFAEALLVLPILLAALARFGPLLLFGSLLVLSLFESALLFFFFLGLETELFFFLEGLLACLFLEGLLVLFLFEGALLFFFFLGLETELFFFLEGLLA